MTSPPGQEVVEVRGSGLYQLVVRLEKKRLITVGRHGRFTFPAGYYVYTGSGRRGLESRIARHLRRQKRMRWHIDYLLRYGHVLEVRRYGDDKTECELSRRAGRMSNGRVIVRGFGSSDCSCPTHLFYFPRNPSSGLGAGQVLLDCHRTVSNHDSRACAVTR